MDPNEIAGYVTEGMAWLAIGVGIYGTALAGLTGVERLFSEKIKSQDDLDRIAQEEAEKLGMTKPFNAFFHESLLEGSAGKSVSGTYEINIGRLSARRSMVRHELYHLYRGHVDGPDKVSFDVTKVLFNLARFAASYFFIKEPQAIAYQVFRIKL